MNLKNKFENQKIVITGGTSGLGRQLVRQLYEKGAQIAVIARTESNLLALKEELPNIYTYSADIGDKNGIFPLAGQISAQLGPIDYLFNVASDLGTQPLKYLIDTECEEFERAFLTNVLGPFRLTKRLLAPMIERRKGVVINISSDAAINPYSKWGAYGVSKAAVDHLSRIFQEESKDYGIQFYSIDPGDMNTPMHFAAVPDANPEDLKDPDVSAKQILELLSQKKLPPDVRRSL